MEKNKWFVKSEVKKGVITNILDTSIPEMLGMVGFDFIWIDGEHGPFSNGEIQSQIISAKAAGVVSFVRVPQNNATIVKPILEMGPNGIIFPMINSKEDAEKAVSSCVYPPKGIRGFGPRRANCYGLDTAYLDNYQIHEWKIMQIEDIKAVENIEEILSVEGIDAILIGPFDLSASMGIIGQTRSDAIIEKFDIIAEAANKAGVPFGAFAVDPKSVEEWTKRGATFLALATDTGLLVSSAKQILQ